MSTVKWQPCTTPFRLVFERVPVNSLAPVWSVFLMWFGSLWVWEGDAGLWLELQLKHFWYSQGQGEKKHKHSHILQEGKVDVKEAAPCRITWWNVTIWIHSGLNLQDLWGVDSHLASLILSWALFLALLHLSFCSEKTVSVFDISSCVRRSWHAGFVCVHWWRSPLLCGSAKLSVVLS